MAQAGAVILGLSLILAGFALVGDALGWWKVPGDFWGAVIVILGAGAKFVSGSIAKTNGAAPNPPEVDVEHQEELAEDDDEDDEDDDPPKKWMGATSTVAVVLLMAGCAGTQWQPAATTWATCAGSGALACLQEAQGEPAEAAINFSACLANQSIKCAAPLVAKGNPPMVLEISKKTAAEMAVDIKCVEAQAATCAELAAQEAVPRAEYATPSCVRAAVLQCWRK